MNVSDKVRDAVKSTALEVCKGLKINADKFNQDACAATAFKCTKAFEGLELLQALYVCSNASALRQAISTEKAQKGAQIAANLLEVVDLETEE